MFIDGITRIPARIQSRLARNRRSAANDEIAELKNSMERLLPGTAVPLRVRLALRIHDRTARTYSTTGLVYGFIAGTWWPMPIILASDDKTGSFRNIIGRFYVAVISASGIKDAGKMVEQMLRLGTLLVICLAFYLFMAIGPTVISLRVANGFPGMRLPGRKTVLLYRHALIVCACASAISACSRVIGKTGERRVVELQKAAGEIQRVRKLLRMLPRFEQGSREGRRRRRRVIAQHVRKVSAILSHIEEQLGDASDQQVREAGGKILQIAERLANRRHRTLLDAEQLQSATTPERESIRFAASAVLTLILSGASLSLLNLIGLSSALEPVAITSSVTVSAVIVFRGKALEKLESLGILKGRSGGSAE